MRMSIPEISAAMGVSHDTVTRAVKELFPESIKHGVKTELTEYEVSRVNEYITSNRQLRSPASVTTDLQMSEMTLKVLQWHADKLAELTPKAAVYDRIADSSGLKTIQEIAAILNIGSKTFFDKLRRDGILYVTGGTNLPKREHIEAGRFKVVEEPFKIGQITNVYSRIFVTPKGELWLAQKYSNSNSHLLIEG